jgi:hypothetical protein
MYVCPYVMYPLFLSGFNSLNAELNPICHLLPLLGARHIFYVSGLRVNGTFKYFDIFSKNSKISNLIKFRPVGTEFYADRQADGNGETNNRFSQFCART